MRALLSFFLVFVCALGGSVLASSGGGLGQRELVLAHAQFQPATAPAGGGGGSASWQTAYALGVVNGASPTRLVVNSGSVPWRFKLCPNSYTASQVDSCVLSTYSQPVASAQYLVDSVAPGDAAYCVGTFTRGTLVSGLTCWLQVYQ